MAESEADARLCSSMFASNFVVEEADTKHVKGKELLTKYSQSETIATGNTMANYFCSKCGTLMYRIGSGFPGKLITRIGTVDDYRLHETKLKPRVEQFTRDRVSWCTGGEGVEQKKGNYYGKNED